MIYDSGILYLAEAENTAEKGRMPNEKLILKSKYWFGERTIGFSRQYAAKGANERIDLLARIPYAPEARIGMFAVLGNKEIMRINAVAHITDNETGLRATELTLERLEKFYDPEAA